MDIELTETKTYSFKLGDKLLDGFVIASEWNGMTELRRPGGDKVIVYGLTTTTACGFMEIFGDVFAARASKEKAPTAARIISASQGILDLIAAEQAPAAK